MNKVRAVLLPAGCTSKEAEGGSGLWVMVSIWPWPLGLGRWCYVASGPRHPLVAPPFRPCLDKWKRAITLEEVSFNFKAKKERGEKKTLLTKWLTLDFKVSPSLWLEEIEVRGLSWPQWVLSLVSRAASDGFRERQQAPQQMADLDYFHIKTHYTCYSHARSVFWNINIEPKSITHFHPQILHLFFKLH